MACNDLQAYGSWRPVAQGRVRPDAVVQHGDRTPTGLKNARSSIRGIPGLGASSTFMRLLRRPQATPRGWLGLDKAGLQVRLTAMAYNLRRTMVLVRAR